MKYYLIYKYSASGQSNKCTVVLQIFIYFFIFRCVYSRCSIVAVFLFKHALWSICPPSSAIKEAWYLSGLCSTQAERLSAVNTLYHAKAIDKDLVSVIATHTYFCVLLNPNYEKNIYNIPNCNQLLPYRSINNSNLEHTVV